MRPKAFVSAEMDYEIAKQLEDVLDITYDWGNAVLSVEQMKHACADKDIIIDTSSKKVRKAHHEWWIQHQIRFSQILASSKVDCTHLRTDEDFVQGLSALFQRRK